MARNYILDEERANKKLQRMAYEILENNLDEEQIIFVGIQENGSTIAANMQKMLSEISDIKTDLIHITLDKKHPGTVNLSNQVDLNNKVIVVIDDVAMSGKTMLYALKPFLEFHPKKIQTLVLVERTHKTFPIKPDYVGISVATTLQEHIFVEVEGDVVKGAWLE